MPGHIPAALESRVLRMEVFRVYVSGGIQARRGPGLVTEEAADDRALFGIDETVVARPGGKGQYLGNEVEIQRREKRGLPVTTLDIIEEGHIVIPCTRGVYA